MKPWLSAGGLSLALALSWAGAECSSWAQSTAPRRGPRLQFSPRQADATNALSEHLERKDELQNPEDGLFNLSKPTVPRSSMGGLPPAIVIRRSLPSKERRDLFELRRNWMLSSQESLPGGPGNSGQTADLEELQKAGKLTAVDQVYLQMFQQQNGSTRTGEQKLADGAERENNSSKLPPALRAREEELKRLLNSELENSADKSAFDSVEGAPERAQGANNTSSRIIALPVPTPETRKENPVDTYRQLLGLPSPSLELVGLFRAPNAAQDLGSSAHAMVAQPSGNPAVLPSTSQNLTTSLPGQAPAVPAAAEAPHPVIPGTPATTANKLEPQRHTPPPPPTFAAPRRMF